MKTPRCQSWLQSRTVQDYVSHEHPPFWLRMDHVRRKPQYNCNEHEQQQKHQQQQHARSRKSIGRRLFSPPTLWQDWDSEQEAGDVRYWELFMDLVIVAAASSIADGLKEDPSLSGLMEFTSLYMIIINGWTGYTHHFTARYEDRSLFHSFILFWFLLGMAGQIVNASYDTAVGFCWSVLLQRGAYIAMLLTVLKAMPERTGPMLCVTIPHTIVGMAILVVTLFRPDWTHITFPMAGLWDFSIGIAIVSLVPGRKLIPINIEHAKDRMGVLVLVMMGETVISSTITYREVANEHRLDASVQRTYYILLTLTFMLIFAFTLLFFHVEPAPNAHALRRSRFTGLSALMLNTVLGIALLLMGVALKLAIKSVVDDEKLTSFTSNLLAISVGCSMVILLLTRCCHYLGILPRASDPPDIQNIFRAWWVVFGVMSFLPFLFCHVKEPCLALAIQAAIVLTLCVIESWFTTVLEDHLPTEEGEDTPLTASFRDVAS